MRTKKKLSLLILFALLLSAIAPFSAFADDPVAKIGDKTYTKIETAISELQEGDTLELLSDVTSSVSNIDIKVSATIDGKGYTYHYTGSDYPLRVWDDAGTVTFRNMTIESAKGAIKLRPRVTLVLESSMKINTQGTMFLFYGANNASTDAVLRIKGGEYATTASGLIVANTDSGKQNTGRKILIEGGTFTVGGGYAIVGSDIYVEMSGGLIVSTEKNTMPSFVLKGSSEMKMTGGAIVNKSVSQNGSSTYALTLRENSYATIYDGYLFAAGGQAVHAKSPASTKKNITIYGGTFVTEKSETVAISEDANRPIVVYGGQFFNIKNQMTLGSEDNQHYDVKGGYVYAVGVLGGTLTEDTAAKYEDGTTYVKIGSKYTYMYSYMAETTPKMLAGASARLVEGSNGIRFESTISKETIDYVNGIKDQYSQIGFGTVICPTDQLENIYGMSMNALTAMGVQYENVIADEGKTEDEAGNVHLRAALVNLQPENIGRRMSAVSYISYVKDGKTVYIYGAYVEKDSSRSMTYIADAALKDVKDTQTGLYKYEYNGKYSPYTDAQRAILQGYLDSAAN